MVGPTFRGLYGQRAEFLAGGRTRTEVMDEAHLRRRLLHPGALRLKGYPEAMPPVQLGPGELDAIVATLKGLQ